LEFSTKLQVTQCRKNHRARIPAAPRPPQFEETGKQGRARGTGEVLSALAPVQAGSALGAALLGEGGDVDTEVFEQRDAAPAQTHTAFGVLEALAALHVLEHLHGEFAGEMVVANSRRTHRG